MNTNHRWVPWVVWGALALVIGAILIAFVRQRLAGSGAGRPLPIYGRVPDFTLTNQSGATVRLADLRGRVWLADVIFTRCAGPCPKMTGRWGELAPLLAADDAISLVTLTTDPEFDTVETLRAYAERFRADPARWHFLTGSKAEIARLAVDGLKLTALEKTPETRENPSDLFIHSTISVLVDKQGRVRGTFETLEPGFTTNVLAAVKRLLRER
jgi:cytochrome oxidase Cu insertion factor (SCO1/SenC/PrrC family)